VAEAQLRVARERHPGELDDLERLAGRGEAAFRLIREAHDERNLGMLLPPRGGKHRSWARFGLATSVHATASVRRRVLLRLQKPRTSVCLLSMSTALHGRRS
jgi:hypothetical protein